MIDVEKLRRDYMTASRWLVDIGEWSDAKSKQIGEEIKTAMNVGDKEKLSTWAAWLSLHADLSRDVRAEDERHYQRAAAELAGQLQEMAQ